MKKGILTLALLIACPALLADDDKTPMVTPQAKKEIQWKTVAKAAMGAGLTVGFGLITYKHIMVDTRKPKGYLAQFSFTTNYFKQNIGNMCIDLLKLAGFIYLTYKSGSYTLAKVGELTKPSAHGPIN